MPSPTAARRGEPSWTWRAGQERRLALIAQGAPIDGRRVLDLGCGIGMYSRRLAELGGRVVAVEAEWCRALEARQAGNDVVAAVGERLPFAAEAFDVVLLHEVLEHVADDRQTMVEVTRLLAPGGRALIFVPNRWWPFETHGVYWRGRYRFGNVCFVNYLPDPLRNRLAPHVRTYTAGRLRWLLQGLPLRIVHHRQIFPGYDNLVSRRPMLGGWLRKLSFASERTPLQRIGLSHFLVVEKDGAPTGAANGAALTGLANGSAPTTAVNGSPPSVSGQEAVDDRPLA